MRNICPFPFSANPVELASSAVSRLYSPQNLYFPRPLGLTFPLSFRLSMVSVAARKRMILTGGVLAAIVSLFAVFDMIQAVPFGGQTMMDIMFLLGAALTGYLAYDAMKDISLTSAGIGLEPVRFRSRSPTGRSDSQRSGESAHHQRFPALKRDRTLKTGQVTVAADRRVFAHQTVPLIDRSQRQNRLGGSVAPLEP